MSEPMLIRCPMYDWVQEAPSREAAIRLLGHHVLTSHSTREQPSWVIMRSAARLAELDVTYVPPDGRWVGLSAPS
jgi:hypothetical protein